MEKQFLHVNQVLNVTLLDGSDEGVFLNEEQLESIDQGLQANQQLVTERDNATATIATMQQTIDDAQGAAAIVFDPLNAIDPTIASATTPEEKATAIRTLLSTKPGTATLLIVGEVESEETDGVDWDTINALEHNKNVDTNS